MFVWFYQRWHRLQARIFTIACRSAFYRIGKKSSLCPPLRLGGEKSIDIGASVFIGPNSWMEVISEGIVNSGPVISIGDEVSIAGSLSITATLRVTIEPRVLIARNVHISDHIHAYERRDRAIKGQGIAKIAAVRVCEGAWIGQGVVVCPGVTIGRNAVIGANSVVRHNIPDFCVAAGAPARVIRKISEA